MPLRISVLDASRPSFALFAIAEGRMSRLVAWTTGMSSVFAPNSLALVEEATAASGEGGKIEPAVVPSDEDSFRGFDRSFSAACMSSRKPARR